MPVAWKLHASRLHDVLSEALLASLTTLPWVVSPAEQHHVALSVKVTDLHQFGEGDNHESGHHHLEVGL
jgi:hypothetical protein